MKNYPVRISGITVNNFKNVVYGKLDLSNDRNGYKASLLGLYGQNGSGKTALIDVLELLKCCLSGKAIKPQFGDFINLDADEATIEVMFDLGEGENTFSVSYQFSIRAGSDTSGAIASSESNGRPSVVVFDEIVRCPLFLDSKKKNGKLLDTSAEIISPVQRKNLLVGKEKDTELNLMVAKKLAAAQSRSFVFSREFLSMIHRRIDEKTLSSEGELEERSYYASILDTLSQFGRHGLFVINTTTSGLISLDAQPISFKYREDSGGVMGTILLPLNASVLIPFHEVEVAKKIIENMNVVLVQIVPGLTIGIKELGTEALPDGNTGCKIQLMSLKNSKEIPLKYESEGIKKIISILQLLVVVYNQRSITVAVDELDSGIFEYLLGELLRIIAEKGKGQLIFTSHNLRPLETLDKSFIAFTTTNPLNRYVRMQGVKGTNNLRDLYYRNITLAEQKEELYDSTQNAEISFAFREAGVNSGR